MAKRMLDCKASDLAGYGAREILESIAASEGRVMMGECIGITRPLLTDITNAEVAPLWGQTLYC